MRDSLAVRFMEFHQKNPEVYRTLFQLAYNLYVKGIRKYGIAGLWEVMRWQMTMELADEEFKLNNDYKAFYARLLMAQNSFLEGFFTVRNSEADEAFAYELVAV